MMRRSSVALLAAALGAGTLSTARDAHALGPVDLELGGKLGMGTNPSNNSGGPNPLGLGLGARGGVSFMGLYGGLNLVYYFGSSQNVEGISASEHSLLYGIEAGYGIKLLGLLTLRAQLGLGNAAITGSGSAPIAGASASTTNNYLYLEPGVTAMVSLGMWFVGADVNALILTGVKNGSGGSSTDTALTWHGQVGITF